MSRKSSLAKISRPRLFGVVPRERLFTLLDDNRGRPLIWISGPPGAGKTALVASYLETRAFPALWYQIDKGDADPAAFFLHLALGAEGLRERDEPPLPRFVAEHASHIAAFARLFFRAFFAQLPEGVILVLDNYQEAPHDAPLHAIVREAVAQVPPNVSVIGISREAAPPPFIQLSASGAMLEMGWDKIQLTLEEVRAIAAPRNICDDWLIRALHQQSQGWAAGITLMLERLGHVDDKAQELPTETRESVFNYFASLIFDQGSEESRHILLSIAFLPRVTASLAIELSSRSEALDLLDDLYRRRMFTDRRAGIEPVYQFHALFVDFLRSKAKAILNATRFADLLQRSARALEAIGEHEAAMELWIALHDWEQASRLVLAQANTLLSSGRRQTLMRWIAALPDQIRNKPWLLYWAGNAKLQIDPEEGIKSLRLGLELFRQSEDRPGHILCLTTLLGGGYIGYAGIEAMDKLIDELFAQSDSFADILSVDMQLQVWGVLCIALIYVRPWHAFTMLAPRKVEELLPRCADPKVGLTAGIGAISTCMLAGEFERGDRLAEMTKNLAQRDTASPSEAAWWHCQVGYLGLVEAKYESALESLAAARRIAESNGLRTALMDIMLHQTTVEYRAKGWTVANETLNAVEALARSSPPGNQSLYFLLKARRSRHRGQGEEGSVLAMNSYRSAVASGSRLWEMIIGLCVADLLIDAGDPEQALPLIARSKELIDQSPSYDCWRAALAFLPAWLTYAAGDRTTASAQLRDGLKLAHAGRRRYYLRFLDRCLRELLPFALSERIEVGLAQELICLFHLKPTHKPPENWPWPVRILTLGRFELQIKREKLEFSRKLPRKTLLLLKAIVAFGGRDAPEQTLCDALWGDEEGDAARNALAITVLRLRKLLGSNESIIYQGGKVALNAELCWVDAWDFEAQLADSAYDRQAVLALYGGNFLPEDEGEPWSVAPRERLRGRFIDALSAYGASLESTGDLGAAVQCYLRGIDADPIVESFHQGLMRCYEKWGKRSEAFSVYRRLKQTLSVLLGVPPSDATQKLFQNLLQRQARDGARLVEEDGATNSTKAAVVTRLPQRRTR